MYVQHLPTEDAEGLGKVNVWMKIGADYRVVKISRQPAHFTGYFEYCASYSE